MSVVAAAGGLLQVGSGSRSDEDRAKPRDESCPARRSQNRRAERKRRKLRHLLLFVLRPRFLLTRLKSQTLFQPVLFSVFCSRGEGAGISTLLVCVAGCLSLFESVIDSRALVWAFGQDEAVVPFRYFFCVLPRLGGTCRGSLSEPRQEQTCFRRLRPRIPPSHPDSKARRKIRDFLYERITCHPQRSE